MFRGVSTLSLDAKGRMAMPAKYRERLVDLCEGQLVVTVDRDCLLLYPLPQWEEIERKLVRLPTLNAQARRLQRLLIGHATECELDGNGRILLPTPLREFARLEKRVVLIGQGKKSTVDHFHVLGKMGVMIKGNKADPTFLKVFGRKRQVVNEAVVVGRGGEGAQKGHSQDKNSKATLF